ARGFDEVADDAHIVQIRAPTPSAMADALDAVAAAAVDCEREIAAVFASATMELLRAAQTAVAVSRYHHLAVARVSGGRP
ncbi:hypothetical protein ACWC3X_42830, partial [Streptomyces populi]